jgi:predicted phosphoribosyltransferase
MRFRDREDAGKQLLEHLKQSCSVQEKTAVLALPRGGVPVGYEIAEGLGVPLDTVVVRKLGAPSNPEFAFGALAYGDTVVLDERTVRYLGIPQNVVDSVVKIETAELNRRKELYRSGEFVAEQSIEHIILVDDGLATGATMQAAVKSLRKLYSPDNIVVAVPVASTEAAKKVQASVDWLVCLYTDPEFMAVGQYYERFDQVSDEEVIELLSNHQPLSKT